ncbi:iron ABC transporter permease, partial [Nostoc sp. 3335mG]
MTRVASLALWLLLLASATIAVTLGPADITPSEVWLTILHHLGLLSESPVSRLRDAIVWELRLPRVLAALGVGAG